MAVLLPVGLLIAAVIFLPAASLSVHDVLRGLSFAGIFLGILTIMVVGVAAFFVLLLLAGGLLAFWIERDGFIVIAGRGNRGVSTNGAQALWLTIQAIPRTFGTALLVVVVVHVDAREVFTLVLRAGPWLLVALVLHMGSLACAAWAWRALISETGVENLFRVEVSVSIAGSDYDVRTVTGFIGEPVRPGQSNRAFNIGPRGPGSTE